MKPDQKSLRIGAAVIILAVALRFLGSSLVADMTQLFTNPTVASVMLYAGTGRVYRAPASTQQETTEPAEASPEEPQPTQAVFSPEDAALVSVTNYPGYSFDVEAMLQEPLTWDLTTEEPAVLIIHSHASESYKNTENYTETTAYRTMDEQYNMISIGQLLAQKLEEKGISVLHDTTVHDYPSYNDSYTLSRQTVQEYLEQYPSIRMVLDIHRDACSDESGNQISSTVNIGGVTSSRLMIVTGTDANNNSHPNWKENLSTAVKLQAVMEQLYPGLCRNLCIRSSAFNQDLCPGMLLIEVGTAGDTRQQALNAAAFLADGIAALAYGST